ncbi:HK97 family phage prohead protease [Bifidobacterium simiiventris]|uniref:HK97 family phage prohead protease n=1 Tax=Bifidobacterium simiiventris TaxID=2834434 RepID=UPI001C580AEB|nr:HK97 family phage prohead protease [Bifidobacterium simiiventris]MBW3077696.1 HK97 family phage prohead protease [Bifidobacterium simiiventris]
MHMRKDFTFQMKDDEDNATGGGTLVAYASTFDRDPDSYGDVIAPGAFTDTLKAWKESGNTIPLLFGHRTDDPTMNIGGVTDAVEDERGLKITAEFDPDNPTAQYVRKLVKEKRLSKMSFAFDVLEDGQTELDDGMKAHELRKLDLFEVSLVPIPANQHADVVDVKQAGFKSGRTLSKKNEDKLRQALGLLKEVVSTVDSDDTGSNDSDVNDPGNSEDPKKGNEEATDARRSAVEEITNLLRKSEEIR